MSDKQKPTAPEWALYLLLGLAGGGGLISGGSTLVDRLSPRVDAHSVDLRVLVQQVQRHEERLGKLDELIERSEASRLRTKATIGNHEQRLGQMEQIHSETARRLDELRVDIRVLCRSLEAPCGR